MQKATNQEELNQNEEDTSISEGSTEENNEEESEGEADTSENTTASDSENDDSEPDFSAELEAEKQKRLKAENAAIKYKKKLKEATSDKKPAQEEAEQDLPTPDVEQIAKRTAELVREEAKREMVSDEIDSQLTSITDGDERELTRFHYENTVKPTGFTRQSIAEDISRARLIANEKKIMSNMSELAQALKSQAGATKSGLGSSVRKPKPAGQELSSADKRFLKQRGQNPDHYRIQNGQVVKVK